MKTRKDWLLLLLAATDGASAPPAIDRVRAMKCLFVLGERLPRVKEDGYYSFEPYNYGPFDSRVYRDAEELEAEDLVEGVLVGGYKGYRATPKGIQVAGKLAVQDKEATGFLLALREWANRLSFNALLKTIYSEWPAYRAKSVFVE